MCPCPVLGLAKLNVLQAEVYPGFVTGFRDTSREENTLHISFFQSRIAAKKHDPRDVKAEEERGVCCITLFSPMRSGNYCFAFFSLKNILPLPNCVSRRGAEAAASQGITPDRLQGTVNPIQVKGGFLPV